jgi:hypothetical protein
MYVQGEQPDSSAAKAKLTRFEKTMSLSLLIALLLQTLLSASIVGSFTVRPALTTASKMELATNRSGFLRNEPPAKGVDSLSLLGTLLDRQDRKVTAQVMAASVARWLDTEYLPQTIHSEIGDICASTYVQCRENNQDDVMSILMAIADDLSLVWTEKFYQDAFVNPYDVANYVSGMWQMKMR